MDGIKRPKSNLRELFYLTVDESNHLLSVINAPKHYLVIYLAIMTGLRRSELLGLRWQDIDFGKNTLTVNQTVLRVKGGSIISPTTKNKTSRRTITLDANTIAKLKKYRVEFNKQALQNHELRKYDLIFVQPDGNPHNPSWTAHLIRKYIPLAQLSPKITFHSLRHTHATMLIQAGVHFKVIQARLGHSTF